MPSDVPHRHELKELLRAAKQQGWRIRRLGTNHFEWRKRGRKPVISGSTITPASVSVLRAKLGLRNEGKQRAKTTAVRDHDVSELPGPGDLPAVGEDAGERPDRERPTGETDRAPLGAGPGPGVSVRGGHLDAAPRDLPGSPSVEGTDEEEPAADYTDTVLIRDRDDTVESGRATAEDMPYFLAIKLQATADDAATAALDMDPDTLTDHLADVWEVMLTLADALVPGGHWTVDQLRRQKNRDYGGYETGRLLDVPVNNGRETS